MTECDKCCRGSAPYFMCRRSMDCICHKIRDEQARVTPNRLPWADHTANTAIGRTK